MEFNPQSPPAFPVQSVPQHGQRSPDIQGETPKRTPNPTPCVPCSHPSVKSKCEMSSPWSSTLCQRCSERGITCIPKPKARRKPRTSRKLHLHQQVTGEGTPHREGSLDSATPATIPTPIGGPKPDMQSFVHTFETSAPRTLGEDINVAEPSNSKRAYMASSLTQAGELVSQNVHEQPVQTPYASHAENNHQNGYGIGNECRHDPRSMTMHLDTLDANAPPPALLSGNLSLSTCYMTRTAGADPFGHLN